MSTWTRPEHGSGRVLFPPEVDDREWLMGLVHKAASDNLHTNVGAILKNAGQPHARTFDLSQSRLELMDGLARVLGVPVERLSLLANSAIGREGSIPIVSFLGAEVPAYDLVTRGRRLSTGTLAREPFHRAVWQHRLLPYCPHSLELLRDTCRVCGARLDWYRAEGLTTCSAADCTADLRRGQQERLTDDHAASYRRMGALVAPHDAAVPRPVLHPDLVDLDSGTVFELGWRLASTLTGSVLPRNEAGRMSSKDILTTLLHADDIILAWPDAYRSALQRMVKERGADAGRAALKRLRSIARVESGWPQLSVLLRSSMPDLLQPGRLALRCLDVGVISGTDLQHKVRISPSTLANLKRSSAVDPVLRSGTLRTFHDFDLEIAEAFASAKNGSVPYGRVGEALGISGHGVEQLVVFDVLIEESHATLRSYLPALRIRIESLDRLTIRLATASDPHLEDGVHLHRAVKAIGGEKPWGPIASALLKGEIRFRLLAGPQRVFQRLLVDEHDVSILTSMRFDRSDHPGFSFARDMTKRDLEEALNLKPGYARAVMQEELRLSGRGARASVEEVTRIARERISGPEVLSRFGPGGRRLPAALKRAKLVRGTAGWSRGEVEALLSPSAEQDLTTLRTDGDRP